MSVVTITCNHKYEDKYNFRVSDVTRDDENVGFDVDITVTVNESYTPARIYYSDNDHPADYDFEIDYDSFDFDLQNHPEDQKQRAIAWCVIHNEKGVFEDAFAAKESEIESEIEFRLVEAILPYSNLNFKDYKDSESVFACARFIIQQLTSKDSHKMDIYNLGVELDNGWLMYVDYELLKHIELIDKEIEQ